MRTMMVALLCGVSLAAFNHSAACAEVLITADEAKLPAPSSSATLPTRGLTRGPGIEQESPLPNEIVHSPLPFKIRFAIRNNVDIDRDSVRLTYIRATPVDLTTRIKKHVQADGIVMNQAEVPPGTHLLRLELKDMQGRVSTAVLKLNVTDR